MAITWILPLAGQLTNEIELTFGEPVFSTILQADNLSPIPPFLPGPVYYKHISGDLPLDYIIENNGLTATLKLEQIIRELDEYVDGFQEPENFTYDGENKAGENYASYGSALYGSWTATFTIRAYDATGLINPDDNTDFGGRTFSDRTFSIVITNNWSSDRDRFILRYFETTGLDFDGDTHSDPTDFLVSIKSKGYYD